MTTPDTLRQLQAAATPGPWKVTKYDVADGGWNIARDQPGLPDWQGLVLADSSQHFGAVQDEANARLIAAAPTHLADLITALEREAKVRELHKPHGFGGEWTSRLCDECGHPTPCPTIRILDGNE